MSNQELKTAPEPTLRRLPPYYQFLKELQHHHQGPISCTRIAEAFKLDPTQVRKDIAATGIVGKPRVGYEIGELIKAIEDFMGWSNVTDAFLAGAGNLGSALLGYEGFADYGLNIVAAFDADPSKIGTQIHGKMVMPLEKMPALARRMNIHIGIITTPAEAAQYVADLMVAGEMRAIWNFAPVRLQVPPEIIVENQQLSASLAVLSSKLAAVMRSAES